MTVGEVAEELKLPPARVYKLIRGDGGEADPLPAHRVGSRTIRVRREDLYAWLNARKMARIKEGGVM